MPNHGIQFLVVQGIEPAGASLQLTAERAPSEGIEPSNCSETTDTPTATGRQGERLIAQASGQGGAVDCTGSQGSHGRATGSSIHNPGSGNIYPLTHVEVIWHSRNVIRGSCPFCSPAQHPIHPRSTRCEAWGTGCYPYCMYPSRYLPKRSLHTKQSQMVPKQNTGSGYPHAQTDEIP